MAAVCLYLLAEAAVFRSGWYCRYLEPNSSAGEVEYRLRWTLHTPRASVPEVAVVGDSRIAEGFSARNAGKAAGGRLHFTNMGLPGTSPRVWYYLLRDADPDRRRFSTIVLAFDQYSDQDSPEDLRNRPTDIHYVAGRLGFEDCFDFADSFPDRKLRAEALSGCFLKGIAFRADVQAFLSDIPGRVARAKDWRDNGYEYNENYGGMENNLTGLQVNAETREIHFPPNLTEQQMATIRSTCLPSAATQTGFTTLYRKEWIGSILDLYRGTKTRFVFLQIPRSPQPLPEQPTRARFIESVASNPSIRVLPTQTFKDLEKPETFGDGLHMNHTGRAIFSERLAHLIEGDSGR